jgi:uncharacterized membrane protein YgcG
MVTLDPMQRIPTQPPSRKYRARRGFALMDAVIAGILLSIGLVTVLSVGGQAMTMQRRGEVDVRASAALDELLSAVLTEGPEDYEKLHPLSGSFEADSPFQDFQFTVEIERGGAGVPARVLARVIHEGGREYSIETSIAEKRGDEPDPVRTPSEPIDRVARIEQKHAARDGQGSAGSAAGGGAAGGSASSGSGNSGTGGPAGSTGKSNGGSNGKVP